MEGPSHELLLHLLFFAKQDYLALRDGVKKKEQREMATDMLSLIRTIEKSLSPSDIEFLKIIYETSREVENDDANDEIRGTIVGNFLEKEIGV